MTERSGENGTKRNETKQESRKKEDGAKETNTGDRKKQEKKKENRRARIHKEPENDPVNAHNSNNETIEQHVHA